MRTSPNSRSEFWGRVAPCPRQSCSFLGDPGDAPQSPSKENTPFSAGLALSGLRCHRAQKCRNWCCSPRFGEPACILQTGPRKMGGNRGDETASPRGSRGANGTIHLRWWHPVMAPATSRHHLCTITAFDKLLPDASGKWQYAENKNDQILMNVCFLTRFLHRSCLNVRLKSLSAVHA